MQSPSFPSLMGVRTGKIVRLWVDESTIKLEGIKEMEMARYIINNKEKTGNLGPVMNLLPYRAKKGGCTPGMKNKEILGREKETEITWMILGSLKPPPTS